MPTLPVLYALASEDSDPGAVRLRQILADGPVTDDAVHAEALELLRDSVALKRARETVRGYAEQARAQLQGLPRNAARDALASLCDVIADSPDPPVPGPRARSAPRFFHRRWPITSSSIFEFSM